MSSPFPNTYLPDFHDKNVIERMIYSDFGETGLKVSHLGFGGSTVAFCESQDEENEAIETVISAIKSGINYIDTAPYYGEGKSEIVLGKALRKIPRQTYYIGTKVGRYTLDIPTMFDFSASRTLKSIEESLDRLGLTYVDVIQVHDVEFAPSLDIIINETLPALQSIKDSGKAKYIGITGYPVSTLKKIVELSRVKIDFVLSYCRCSLFDSTLLDYLPYFRFVRVGVINAAILGMSLLTNSTLPSWHPVKSTLREACANAVKYCKENNVNISRLGTFYALSQTGMCTHLVGMANREVLKENLHVLYNGLSKAEKQVFEQVQEKFFKHLTEKDWENREIEMYRPTINNNKS